MILIAAVSQGNHGLAVVGVIYSVIAAAYYLIILKALFFDKPIQIVARGSATYRKHDLIMNLVLAALVLGLTFSLLYPTPLLSFIHRATMALMYL